MESIMSDESNNQETAKPTITLQDIASVVEILRVVTDRGVWKVTELSAVGQVYDRLVKFLDSAGVNVNRADNADEKTEEK